MRTLRLVGLSDSVSGALLGDAAAAWQCVHWDSVALMHPACVNGIAEARRGVVEEAQERSSARAELESMRLADRDAAARAGAHPRHLLGPRNNKMAVSWLVLPRAYDQLEERHACHIQHYARALRKQDESAFQQVLARITVEFIANYSVKYERSERARARILTALVNAYEALFWRNLRMPPRGSENALAFEGFLLWVASAQRRFTGDDATRSAVVRMLAARNELFPPSDAFGRTAAGGYDAGLLALCLRHGEAGVEAALQRFAVSPLFEAETLGRVPIAAIPKLVSSLARQLAQAYASESRNTQRSIRAFFERMEGYFDVERLRDAFAPRPLPADLRFVASRVSAMCRGFVAALPEESGTQGSDGHQR